MSVRDKRALLSYLRAQLKIDWWGHHGIAHWARVRANGLMIATATGANKHVVELFAYFHDSRRLNEHEDPGHGARGGALAQSLRGDFFDATGEEMDQLLFACQHHSDGMTRGDATVLACWDADRLDLGRVGITPKAKYLCTEIARTDDFMRVANQRAQTWRATYDARRHRR